MVGLLTGSSVVAFNFVIHYIRDLAWQHTPLSVDNWCNWARSLPLSTSWHTLVVPPVVGGLIVGTLRSLSGSLQETPSLDPLLLRAARSASPQRSFWPSIRFPVPFTRPEQATRQSATPGGSPASESNAGPQEQLDEPPLLPLARETSTENSNPLEEDLQQMLGQQRESGQHDAGPSSTSGGHGGHEDASPFAPVLRALAAAVTLGTGNSLGPEGPRSAPEPLEPDTDQHSVLRPVICLGPAAGQMPSITWQRRLLAPVAVQPEQARCQDAAMDLHLQPQSC